MIVIHEAMGLNEHIRDVANRFANIGYVALGVDLYTREGGPPPMDDVQAMMARLFSMSDATVLGDLEGAADHLRGLDGVTGRIGCIGFCMGGRYTLLFACASDRLNAAVDCWGGFIDRATPDERSTPAAPDAAAGAGRPAQLPAAGGGRRRGPEPLARAGRAAARRGRRERAGGQSRRLRGRRATRSSPTTARPTGPARRRSCGREIVPFLQRHLQAAA